MLGDCERVLQKLPDNSIDLIFTSPPYANQRQRTYGGISPDTYVDWFMSKAAQFMRILKPTGTFILNIKERVVDGERHTYVIELILAMREQGWLQDLKNATVRIKQSKRGMNVQAVLGICYGKTRTPYLRGYIKVVGQNFWYLISESKDLHTDIIGPLGEC
jgi:DNA modification methylase